MPVLILACIHNENRRVWIAVSDDADPTLIIGIIIACYFLK